MEQGRVEDGAVTEPVAGGEAFPPTRWTLVTQAGAGAQQALEWLCRQYWQPIRAYLRRYRLPHEDAEDLTQSFLVHLLASGRLARPQRHLGTFRGYLKAALTNYVTDHLRRTARTPRMQVMEGAAGAGELVDPQLTPDAEYDRNFVLNLLHAALDQVRSDYVARGLERRFELLRDFLPGRDPDRTQAEAATLLEISEGAVAKAVFDLRSEFRRVYRRLAAQIVPSPMEVEAEIAHHLAILRRPGSAN